ncbi:MAG TPA: DUF1223 domain-containing protein [Candidatus Methylacidiphilales bacterium]|jgi:hypothetical protein|nr:DUF1223 domain-containing protein [Candidatus Methylacidiphilales bacterium]
MKCFLLFTVGGLLMPLLSLRAQDAVFTSKGAKASLVELYTSEGCSSCPPAEAWLGGLKTDPGLWREVFPVAFHINYWDDLGWTDRFATPAITQRQRDYAARLGQDSVYTPEFIVNGREWRRGWLSAGLPAPAADKAGTLTVRRTADQTITAQYALPPSAPREPCTLNVALLGFNIASDVRSGENGGRKLQHDFLALGFATTTLTPGSDGVLTAGPLHVTTLAGETPGALVAWVSGADGKILQVTGGWLPGAH